MGFFNKDPGKIWHKAHDALQKQKWEKALPLLKEAAEGGHVMAQFRYAEMFEQGLGTVPDIKSAEFWYEKAAEQGNTDAMVSLARLLCQNLQISGNSARAYTWYQAAEKILHKNKIEHALLQSIRYEANTIREKALEERSEARRKGSAAYDSGDYQTAIFHFKEGALRGCETSQQNYAIMLAKGEGTDKDLTGALYWMQRAADNGAVYAQYLCGDMYLYGMGIEADPRAALKCYLRAARAGYAEAQYQCGRMYYEKLGTIYTSDNFKTARKWLDKAAEQGNEKAIKLIEDAFRELGTPEEQYQKGLEEYNAGHIDEALDILDNPAAEHCIPAVFLCIKINVEIGDEESALHWYNVFLEESDYFTDDRYSDIQNEIERLMAPWKGEVE